jgi:serralysin
MSFGGKMDKICYTPGSIPVPGASISRDMLWTPGQTITVQSLNVPPRIWQDIISAACEWTKYAHLQFQFLSRGRGQIKVAWGPGGGSWSYIGKGCLSANPSMSFGWEDRVTYMHEFGHAIGFNHSHNAKNFPYHFNEPEVIRYFSGPPNNWPISMIRSNILTPVQGNVVENKWENRDIMNYFYPAKMIKEGVAIEPGKEISESEKSLCKQMYPGLEPDLELY